MEFYYVMMLITSLQDDFGDVGNIQVLVQGLVGDIPCCIKALNLCEYWRLPRSLQTSVSSVQFQCCLPPVCPLKL
jgi:hypothetical protein